MRKFFFAFFLLGFRFCLYAKSFSLQIIQKNTPLDIIFETSYVVEQTILDYFFERGAIVSSCEILILQNKNDENHSQDFSIKEAKLGGMDFFIKVILNYNEQSEKKLSNISLENIVGAEFEIISLLDLVPLTKEKIFLQKPNHDKGRNGIESFARQIALSIQEKLANTKEW